MPVNSSNQQTQTINRQNNANSVEQDTECRNIHVAFCGDGIVDNSTADSSTNINDPLNGGEICDDGNTNNNDACKNDCTRNTPACGVANGQTYYDTQEPPLGDVINA